MRKYKKRYFYVLYFSHSNNGDIDLNLGVFSTIHNVNQKIELSLSKPGFKNYSRNNFIVDKTAVKCSNVEKDKISHLYWLFSEVNFDDSSAWRDYGYYYYKKDAISDLNWIINNTRYGKKNVDSFNILRINVNNVDCWSEGFDVLDI